MGYVVKKLNDCLECSAFGFTHAGLVCYTAVFSGVTQRSSPLTAAVNRITFLSRD